MRKAIKLIVATFLIALAGPVLAQSAIIRGEISAGSYENLRSDGSGHLVVNVNSAPTPAAAAGVTFTNTNVTVTNASGTALAANASRKYLSVQNNDAAGIIYCTPTATATTALGVKISAGQMWSPGVAPVNAILCIGSIASNANVVITEGQ